MFVHEVRTTPESATRHQMWVNEGGNRVKWVIASEGYEHKMGKAIYQLTYSRNRMRWVSKDTYAQRKSVDNSST